jgi:phenylpyruvate tautomerase PptA (4-oxalocrotonate tautomerase family)
MSQLNLKFIDLPLPQTLLWEQLDDKQKQIIIETLARLIAKAARASKNGEPAND